MKTKTLAAVVSAVEAGRTKIRAMRSELKKAIAAVKDEWKKKIADARVSLKVDRKEHRKLEAAAATVARRASKKTGKGKKVTVASKVTVARKPVVASKKVVASKTAATVRPVKHGGSGELFGRKTG